MAQKSYITNNQLHHMNNNNNKIAAAASLYDSHCILKLVHCSSLQSVKVLEFSVNTLNPVTDFLPIWFDWN